MAHIRLKNVYMDFQIHDARSQRLLHPHSMSIFLGGKLKISDRKRVILSALRDISLNIEDGDCLGLIGHNGSGKSTLLRVLAGIYHPSRGAVERVGRVTPMFSTSIGMADDFTGHENIKICGKFFNMSHKEIDAATPEIIEFTQLGEYLDLPVRTYSEGMRARLAFAIATAKLPEILLLDEGIGAGDATFQEKAQERLHKYTANSSIIVLASHSIDLMRKFCTSALVLEEGAIVFHGGLNEAYELYEKRVSAVMGT